MKTFLVAMLFAISAVLPIAAETPAETAQKELAASKARIIARYPSIKDPSSPLTIAVGNAIDKLQAAKDPVFNLPNAPELIVEAVAKRLGIAPAPTPAEDEAERRAAIHKRTSEIMDRIERQRQAEALDRIARAIENLR
jgi:hypothetical protein